MVSNLRIEVIDSQVGLSKLKNDWNDLLKKSRINNVFLTWEWISAWLKCFLNHRRKLFVIAVYSHGELLGAAPWYIEAYRLMGLNAKRIVTLGNPEGDADYLDVIIRKEKEKEVTHCIYDFLFKDAMTKWDLLTFTDIPAESLFLLYYLQQIENAGKYVEVSQGSFCPIVQLPTDWKSYISTLSSNRREQFNRHMKVLNGYGHVDYVCNNQKEEIEVNLAEFFSLYEKAWGEKTNVIKMLIDAYCGIVNSDTLRVELLKVDGRVAAGMVNLRYDKKLFMYLMATDKELVPKISVGNLLVGLSIKQAVEEGFEIYDFLKGVEQYKFHWANTGKRSLNVISYRGGSASSAVCIRNIIKNFGKVLLR